MRKALLLVLVLLLTVVCACAAAATDYPLDAISGKISIDESKYVVLTSGNLSDHPDLLSSIGKTAEELKTDWAARGVLLQAWTKDQKTCVEVSVFQDEDSARYIDLESLDNAGRKEYYKQMLSKVREQGYRVTESDYKLYNKSGHYFVCTYHYQKDGDDHRGIMRRTVRNGYTLVVDYQVFNRLPSKTDKDNNGRFMNGIEIVTVDVQPAAISGQETPESTSSAKVPAGAASTLSITVLPPKISNDGVFTVEGTAYPGSELAISAMRLSSTVSHHFNAVASESGKFKVKVALPEEGTYTLSIAMYIDDVPVQDAFLDVVKFSSTQIPYQLNADIPTALTMDKLVISGTTIKGVEIQCIVTVNNGSPLKITPRDTVKTNGNGTFTFTVPTDQEGEYDFVLAFSKKGMNTERLEVKSTRTLSVADQNARTAGKAEKGNYDKLVKKLDSYIGHTISFDAYITEVKQAGDQWMILAALKLNRGKYSNYLVYMADEDPSLSASEKVKIYGVCTGPYSILSEEENVSYPGFDYLFSE